MTVDGLPAAQQPAPWTTTPPAAPATNQLAIVALVASFFVPLAGILCGHLALAQIKRTGEQGHGLALAGTVIGYSLIGIVVLIALASVLFVVVMLATLSSLGPGLPVPVT